MLFNTGMHFMRFIGFWIEDCTFWQQSIKIIIITLLIKLINLGCWAWHMIPAQTYFSYNVLIKRSEVSSFVLSENWARPQFQRDFTHSAQVMNGPWSDQDMRFNSKRLLVMRMAFFPIHWVYKANHNSILLTVTLNFNKNYFKNVSLRESQTDFVMIPYWSNKI